MSTCAPGWNRHCAASRRRGTSHQRYPAAVLLLLLMTAGCTTTTTGSPTAEAAPAPGTSASPGASLPPRPRELPLSGIDPCALLTTDQQADIGVADPTPGTSPELGTPLCQWDRFPAEPQDAYLVNLLTAQGASYALGSATGASITEVAGFAAVSTTGSRALPGRNCLLFIDVAEGQTLNVAYQYEGRTEPMTTEIACDKARTAAELMLETLQTLVE